MVWTIVSTVLLGIGALVVVGLAGLVALSLLLRVAHRGR